MSKKLVQFAPSIENSGDIIYYPGVFGWGVETNGFRIVMYGPAEYDHPAVNVLISRGQKFNDGLDGVKIPGKESLHRKYTSEKRKKRCVRAGEHGPCHVHVFDIRSGHETRFRLVEHYNAEHFVQELHLDEKRKNNLTDKQVKAVAPILNSLVPEFIQCWREMYQDNDLLNGCISRVDKDSNGMVETKYDDGSKEIYDPKSGTYAIVPKKTMEIKTAAKDLYNRDRARNFRTKSNGGHWRQ